MAMHEGYTTTLAEMYEEMKGKTVKLTAVDTTSIQKKDWSDNDENCSVINFTINGKTYSALEDPSDGYRSALDTITVCGSDFTLKNTFPACHCIVQWMPDGTGEYGEKNDVLQLVDVITKEVVLEVGTCNYDDYYPCFVSHFNPAGMASNMTAEREAEMKKAERLLKKKEEAEKAQSAQREALGFGTW